MQPDELVNLLIIVIFSGLVAIIWTFIWYRKTASASASKSHLYEFRNKLLDKFNSADEIINFLKTEEGKKLTESPSPPQTNPIRLVLRYSIWGTISIFTGAAFFLNSNWYHFSNDINDLRNVADLRTWGTIFVMLGFGLLVAALITNIFVKKWKLNNNHNLN